jgi:hypothetical protein
MHDKAMSEHVYIERGSSNFRGERRPVSAEQADFVFGTTPSIDDFYVCVLRGKLCAYPEEKVLFIVDFCGFSDNLYETEEYDMDHMPHFGEREEFVACLEKMYAGWDICWHRTVVAAMRFDTEEMRDTWKICRESGSDNGMLNEWFGFPNDYNVWA